MSDTYLVEAPGLHTDNKDEKTPGVLIGQCLYVVVPLLLAVYAFPASCFKAASQLWDTGIFLLRDLTFLLVKCQGTAQVTSKATVL